MSEITLYNESAVIRDGDPVILYPTESDAEPIMLGTGFSTFDHLETILSAVHSGASAIQVPPEKYGAIRQCDTFEVFTQAGRIDME